MSQMDSSERFVRSTPQSWKQTIGLIIWMAIAGVVCQFAVAYGPTDNQGVRLGLWIGVFASIIMALVMFAALLRFYKVNLLYLPSTWILLLDVVLIVILLYGSQGTNGQQGYSTFQIAMAALILLTAGFSLFLNIVKTNFLFGIILTVIQLALSILVVALAFMIWNERARRHSIH